MNKYLLGVLFSLVAVNAQAEHDNVFVANNGVTLINIPADKVLSRASFEKDFDVGSISYETSDRKTNDKYLMHCFSKRKLGSGEYLDLDPSNRRFCLNETGRALNKGLANLIFPDFKILKEKLENRSVKTMSMAFAGRANMLSLDNYSGLFNSTTFESVNPDDKDYVYSYYSFDPNTGELLNGVIYEYVY